MLAALAGGSLPMIMRTFMEPEKPDIEMGTVSFKSKLDEIIKNFAQLWPIYDFPFEEYKPSEDEAAADSQRKQDEFKQEANEQEDVDTNMTSYRGAFEPENFDYDSGARFAEVNGNIEILNASGNSSKPTSNNSNPKTSSALRGGGTEVTKSPSITPAAKVCFREVSAASRGPFETKIDLIINLPELNEDGWLDEWSDIVDGGDNYQKADNTQLKSPTQSEDSVFVPVPAVRAARRSQTST